MTLTAEDTDRAAPAGAVRRPPDAARTLAVLAALTATLPVDLALTGFALLRRASRPAVRPTARPRTVLVSGGKMTKALHAGPRVPPGRPPGDTR